MKEQDPQSECLNDALELTAKMEPFDTFWEAPEQLETGYKRFAEFYRYNYLPHVPANKESSILVISCGAGYFVSLLQSEGFSKVLGIDSDPNKVLFAEKRKLNCRVARAFTFLHNGSEEYDLIFCEQELNHLTKEEIVHFLKLCHQRIRPGGTLICHALNGANPITGSEALAQNFDHYNTCTEYSMRQVLKYCGFEEIQIFPLSLYIFFKNPLNYPLILFDFVMNRIFRVLFLLQNKNNRIFSKKIGAVAHKRH